MSYQHITLTIHQRIATITLNRPEKANSLHAEAWSELADVLIACRDDESLHVIILRGQGRNFCAGLDREYLTHIATMQALDGISRKERLRVEIGNMQDCIYSITTMPIPVIAAVQGACIGAGLEIAAACDIRICTEEALFSLPEITMGITPDLGALQYLPGIISYGMVMDLALSGKRISAAEALRVGLVSRVCEDQKELDIEIDTLSTQLGSYMREALIGVKSSLQYSQRVPVKQGLHHVLDLTVEHLSKQ